MESNAIVNAAGIYTSGFAFGKDCVPNICIRTHIFRPMGWTSSTSTTSTSSTSTTSTTTTIGPTTSTTSTTSTTTTVAPTTTTTSTLTTTTTTTIAPTTTTTTTVPTEAFTYTVDTYDCDCIQLIPVGIINNNALTVGKWYYHPPTNRKFVVLGFDGMVTDVGDNILDADGKDTCAEVICPTPCTAFIYLANVYSCDCSTYIQTIVFTNSQRLTIGQYYHSPLAQQSWFVSEYNGCFTATPQYSILNSSGTICADSCELFPHDFAEGNADPEIACGPSLYPIFAFSPSEILVLNSQIFMFGSPFSGGDLYYQGAGTQSIFKINNQGFITEIISCLP